MIHIPVARFDVVDVNFVDDVVTTFSVLVGVVTCDVVVVVGDFVVVVVDDFVDVVVGDFVVVVVVVLVFVVVVVDVAFVAPPTCVDIVVCTSSLESVDADPSDIFDAPIVDVDPVTTESVPVVVTLEPV
jgi:hypothetical protein